MELLEKYFDTAFDAPDGIKKLRELILTLAMQGKLVPQDFGDQPASELLKEIEAEKLQLIKEKKIKKQKALPAIDPEEIPFDIPAVWKWVRLSNISTKIHYGYTASANKNSIGIKLLRITDIQNNNVNWETVPTCTAKRQDVLQYLLGINDILIARTGGTVGKSYHVKNISTDAVFASYLIRVVPAKSISAKFLKCFLESPIYWNQLYAACSGTGQPNVNGKSLSSLTCPLPPLEEQHRIVAKVDQLMARCDELEKLRAAKDEKRISVHTSAVRQLLDAKEESSFAEAWQFLTDNFGDLYSVKENVAELRKAILQLAVMGKLVPLDAGDQPASELLKEIEAEKLQLIKEKKIKKQKALPAIDPEEIPFDIPAVWKWVRLSNISTKIHYGYTASANKNSIGIKLLRITDIQNNNVNWETVPTCTAKRQDVLQYLLGINDILIARTGGTVGKSYHVKNISTDAVFASYLIRVVPAKSISAKFLKCFLESPIYWNQLYAACSGTGQPNVNGKSLSSLTCPLPPLEEQHRIVAKVDQLMILCDNLEQQIDRASEKQTALLNAVMAQV